MEPNNQWRKLGWCTWDAFYKEVSLAKVHQGLRSLREIGHKPGWLIIDDGWQQYEGQHLVNKEPDANKFLASLEENVTQLKSEYDITVGVWHPFLGYWGGVKPNSQCATLFNNHFIENHLQLWPQDESTTHIYIYDSHSIDKWYDSYHQYLQNSQVDFVKVDGQAFLEKVLPTTHDFADTSRAYQIALRQSIYTHFSGQNIHCMAHESHILAHASCAIWRNSDDYFPNIEDQGKHILVNILNNIWSRFMGMPDWDMFQSSHAHSEFHAIARVISGGPIYLCDKPNTHNPALIDKLVLHSNELLQPDAYALPSKQSLFADLVERFNLLVAVNTANDANIVGVFNCQNFGDLLCAHISHEDLYTDMSEPCTLFSYRTQIAEYFPESSEKKVTLPSQTADILSFIPIKHNFSLIGVIDKFLSVKTYTPPQFEHNTCITKALCAGDFRFNYYGKHTPNLLLNGKALAVTKFAEHHYGVILPTQGTLTITA